MAFGVSITGAMILEVGRANSTSLFEKAFESLERAKSANPVTLPKVKAPTLYLPQGFFCRGCPQYVVSLLG